MSMFCGIERVGKLTYRRGRRLRTGGPGPIGRLCSRCSRRRGGRRFSVIRWEVVGRGPSRPILSWSRRDTAHTRIHKTKLAREGSVSGNLRSKGKITACAERKVLGWRGEWGSGGEDRRGKGDAESYGTVEAEREAKRGKGRGRGFCCKRDLGFFFVFLIYFVNFWRGILVFKKLKWSMPHQQFVKCL